MWYHISTSNIFLQNNSFLCFISAMFMSKAKDCKSSLLRKLFRISHS